MSLCTGEPAERSLERYIQGTLPELEARSFEEHYFECSACLAQVEALQAVTAHLASAPVPPAKPAPKRLFALPVYAAAGAIAAALVLGFFGLRASHRTQPASAAHVPAVAVQPSSPSVPNTALASLADFSLPEFQASHLRGAGGDANLEAGRNAYVKHDYPSAIHALSLVHPHTEEAGAALFYIGICMMQEHSLDEARLTLHKVVAAGDSPQQEAAWYALAQVALAQGDATTAKLDLTRTIALHGDFERRAREQRDKLR